MKKIVCLILCLSFALCLCACGDNNGGGKKAAAKVEKYAKAGDMPEVEYSLGTAVDKIITDLDARQPQADDEHGHESVYMTYEVLERTIIATGTVNYYYDTDKKQDGISYIVNFGDAYGFEQGTLLDDVKTAMEKCGHAAEREDVYSADIFFLPTINDIEALEYKFGDNTVMFVFQNNCLCACALFR